ncbi:winged helix-turn-helix domain-containing protein [Schinkia azotoformans]|uniref:winged helix-turn-helix domain-containing protein n=1 Tax=Schinkia azotoformans TaxID=1454 RepID=UPI002E207840|nr:winged helix-turn-helix domain-containing protein [Schinkia azotoformans]
MKRDERIILLILQLAKNNGNIMNALNENLKFTTIYEYVSHLKRNGLISDLIGELELTPLGNQKYNELNDKFERKFSDKWISPQYEYIIEKWDKFRIYLP